MKILERVWSIRPFKAYTILRSRSVAQALRRYFTYNEFKTLSSRTPDFRMLLGTAAHYLAIPEAELAVEVAAKLRIPYLHVVSPINPKRLPRSITLSDCRRAGCIPLYADFGIAAVTCVEPKLASNLFSELGDVPLFLSRWLSIAQALSQSEEWSDEAQNGRSEARMDLNVASKALALVVAEALQYGQQHCSIFIGESSIVYRFLTDLGQNAEGKVASSIRSEFQCLLDHYFLADLRTLALPGEHLVNLEVIFKEETPFGVEYRLVWQTIEMRPHKSNEASHFLEAGTVKKEDRLIEEAPFNQQNNLPSTSPLLASTSDSSKSARIMLVEDSTVFAGILSRFLSKQEFDTIHCENAIQALEILSSGEALPDLIVCDLHMPEMSGLQFVRHLRSNPLLRELPLIALTSDDESATELSLLEEGADGFVSKSDDPRLLTAKIKRLLQSSLRRKAA